MGSNRTDETYRSIAELAPLIERGDLSPVDVVQASLDRISQLDPTLNAFLQVWGEESLESARTAEQAIASGGYLGPLHGVPVGIKDLVDVAGYKTTGGSKVLEDNFADSDATVVQKLKTAGAIPAQAARGTGLDRIPATGCGGYSQPLELPGIHGFRADGRGAGSWQSLHAQTLGIYCQYLGADRKPDCRIF